MKKRWLIALLLIWGLAIFLEHNYFVEKQTNQLSIRDSDYYPINYNVSLTCEDNDSIYITEGDEIVCNYRFSSDKNISLILNAEKRSPYSDTNNLVIVDLNKNLNKTIQNAYESKNSEYNYAFNLYPTLEGIYEINLQSEVYSPPLFYEVKESNNLTLNLKFEEKIENLSEKDWVYYLLKNEYKYTDSVETEISEINLSCSSPYKTWFTKDLVDCYVDISNKYTGPLHFISDFKIFKEGEDITQDKSKVIININMLDTGKELSYSTKVSEKETRLKIVSFYPLVKGDYKLQLNTKVVSTNKDEIDREVNNLKSRFNVVSREEYIQREENKKTIFVTLIIALFVSVPIALKAIRDLTKDN